MSNTILAHCHHNILIELYRPHLHSHTVIKRRTVSETLPGQHHDMSSKKPLPLPKTSNIPPTAAPIPKPRKKNLPMKPTPYSPNLEHGHDAKPDPVFQPPLKQPLPLPAVTASNLTDEKKKHNKLLLKRKLSEPTRYGEPVSSTYRPRLDTPQYPPDLAASPSEKTASENASHNLSNLTEGKELPPILPRPVPPLVAAVEPRPRLNTPPVARRPRKLDRVNGSNADTVRKASFGAEDHDILPSDTTAGISNCGDATRYEFLNLKGENDKLSSEEQLAKKSTTTPHPLPPKLPVKPTPTSSTSTNVIDTGYDTVEGLKNYVAPQIPVACEEYSVTSHVQKNKLKPLSPPVTFPTTLSEKSTILTSARYDVVEDVSPMPSNLPVIGGEYNVTSHRQQNKFQQLSSPSVPIPIASSAENASNLESAVYNVIEDGNSRAPSKLPHGLVDGGEYSVTSHVQKSKLHQLSPPSVPQSIPSSEKIPPLLDDGDGYAITSHVTHSKPSVLFTNGKTNPVNIGDTYSMLPVVDSLSSPGKGAEGENEYSLIAAVDEEKKGSGGMEESGKKSNRPPPPPPVLSSSGQQSSTSTKTQQSNCPSSPKPVCKLPTRQPLLPKHISSTRHNAMAMKPEGSPKQSDKVFKVPILPKPKEKLFLPSTNAAATESTKPRSLSQDTQARYESSSASIRVSHSVDEEEISPKVEVDIDQLRRRASCLVGDNDRGIMVAILDENKETGQKKSAKKRLSVRNELGRRGRDGGDWRKWRSSYENHEGIPPQLNFATPSEGDPGGSSYNEPLSPSEIFTVPQHAVPGHLNYCEVDVDPLPTTPSSSPVVKERETFELSTHGYPDAQGYYSLNIVSPPNREKQEGRVSASNEESSTEMASSRRSSKPLLSEGKTTNTTFLQELEHRFDSKPASEDNGDLKNEVVPTGGAINKDSVEGGEMEKESLLLSTTDDVVAPSRSICDPITHYCEIPLFEDQSTEHTMTPSAVPLPVSVPVSTTSESAVKSSESDFVSSSPLGSVLGRKKDGMLVNQRPWSAGSEVDHYQVVQNGSSSPDRHLIGKTEYHEQDSSRPRALSTARRPPPPPPPPSTPRPSLPADSNSGKSDLLNAEGRVLRAGFRLYPRADRTVQGAPVRSSRPPPPPLPYNFSKKSEDDSVLAVPPATPPSFFTQSLNLSHSNTPSPPSSSHLVPPDSLLSPTGSSGLKKKLLGFLKKTNTSRQDFLRQRSLRYKKNKSPKKETSEATKDDRLSNTLPRSNKSMRVKSLSASSAGKTENMEEEIFEGGTIEEGEGAFRIYSTIDNVEVQKNALVQRSCSIDIVSFRSIIGGGGGGGGGRGEWLYQLFLQQL